jgi:hypothetical protein
MNSFINGFGKYVTHTTSDEGITLSVISLNEEGSFLEVAVQNSHSDFITKNFFPEMDEDVFEVSSLEINKVRETVFGLMI